MVQCRLVQWVFGNDRFRQQVEAMIGYQAHPRPRPGLWVTLVSGGLARDMPTSRTAGLHLLPFKNFPDVHGELRYIKRDIILAPIRHMATLERYHAPRYVV